MPERKDVPQGTLDFLLLRLLAREPMHGWGLMQRLRELTDDVFQVTPGALFPALQRIEEYGWASAEWRTSDNNRRGRSYAITRAGRRQPGRRAGPLERHHAGRGERHGARLMTIWSRLRAFARRLRNRASWEDGLHAELQAYLADDIAARVEAGLSPREARRLALAEFGGLDQVKEQVRTGATGAWLEALWQDSRQAGRALQHSRVRSPPAWSAAWRSGWRSRSRRLHS